MKYVMRQLIFAWAVIAIGNDGAHAAAPNIDSFNVQSYIRMTNGQPTSATSANLVFGIFKGTTCIWAKRYTSVSINQGMVNQKLSGAGTNVTAIANGSATPGECVSNFSATTLNAALLNSGATDNLNLRVYSETSLDGFQPIWDIALSSVPSAMVAEASNTANLATQANDLISSIKTVVSAGAADSGKFVTLDSSGKIDNTAINMSGLTIANTQVTGLGTASTVNTGTASGNVPVLNGSGQLATGVMATYTANRIMATNGSGVMSGSYTAVNTSAGAADAGKIPLLTAAGRINNNMIDSTLLTPSSANLSGTLTVDKGGTGQGTLTANSLLVGNGTSSVNFLAPTNGNILYGSGSSWVSGTVDTAGAVDKTTAQTIAGNKTLTGNTAFSGTMAFGNGGSTFSKILNCSIASGAHTSGTARTGTCTGATTASIAQCSPTVAPAAGWIVAASMISAANTVYIMPIRWTGAAAWTSAYNCVVFVP